ncbi:MAG: hypothetical protein EOO24_67030, partial [Comamonadaceae bacterium]
MHPFSATRAGRLPDRRAPQDGTLPSAQLQGRVLPLLGTFRLLRQVGQGRRTTAWLAHDEANAVSVVLKLAARRNGDAAAPSFAREYGMVAGLRHPNVLRLLEHGSAGGMAYLAMEYVDGGDLAQRLQQPVPAAEAVALLRDAASGLAELHRRGLVHRDVKPANLLLRADGTAVPSARSSR